MTSRLPRTTARIRTTVSLSPALFESLATAAARANLPRNEIMVAALTEWLERNGATDADRPRM